MVLPPNLVQLVLLTGLATWAAYATQWVKYGTFSLSVTSFVAFLFVILVLPETKVAVFRIEATCLGAAIAATGLAVLLAVQALSKRFLKQRTVRKADLL